MRKSVQNPLSIHRLCLLTPQGRNEEGGKGGTIPRVPNHCEGCRKVPTISQALTSTQ